MSHSVPSSSESLGFFFRVKQLERRGHRKPLDAWLLVGLFVVLLELRGLELSMRLRFSPDPSLLGPFRGCHSLWDRDPGRGL